MKQYIVDAFTDKVFRTKCFFLICVLLDEEQVKDFIPYAESLKKLPGRMVHITVQGNNGYDRVSRCFAPKIGILEDSVCGSAHCQIIPYWATTWYADNQCMGSIIKRRLSSKWSNQ